MKTMKTYPKVRRKKTQKQKSVHFARPEKRRRKLPRRLQQ